MALRNKALGGLLATGRGATWSGTYRERPGGAGLHLTITNTGNAATPTTFALNGATCATE